MCRLRKKKKKGFLYCVFVCFIVCACVRVRSLLIQTFICRVWIGVVYFINGSIVLLHQQPFQVLNRHIDPATKYTPHRPGKM